MSRTSLRTKLAAVAATGVMALGTGVLAASPAQAAARGAAQAAADCPYEYFCAYEGPGYTGRSIKVWQCNDVRWVPWTTTNGSWINNQTAGTRARFQWSNGTSSYTPGAYSVAYSGVNWGPIHYIDPC